MKDLLFKYINNQCSAEEVHQLLNFFGIPENEEKLEAAVNEYLENEIDVLQYTPGAETAMESVLVKLKQQLFAQPRSNNTKVIPINRNWYRITAAVSIVFIIASGIYWYSNLSNKNNIAKAPSARIVKSKKEILPGGNKAVLTLADGSEIVLDSAANGTVSQQGGIKVIKLDNDELIYNSGLSKSSEILYNTVTTPKGGQYKIVLADGTGVWLNAASSIRFPATFTDIERKVEITGEAYFEVAKNAAMPFRVSVGGMEVQVLGTHFNINAYSDESEVKTTLLEGSVKVTENNNTALLKPGEQAGVNNIVGNIAIKQVDVDKVVAWKNGLFRFDGDDIDNIMRQISRWYDVDVQYEGKKPQGHFSGIINRNLPLSKLLYMLKLNEVKFDEKGKGVTIKSE